LPSSCAGVLSMAISKIVSIPYHSRARSHPPPCVLRWMMQWHPVACLACLNGRMDDRRPLERSSWEGANVWSRGRLSTSRRRAQSSAPGCRLRPSPSVEADSEPTFRRPTAPSCPIPPLGVDLRGFMHLHTVISALLFPPRVPIEQFLSARSQRSFQG
jgi:hypothetical protein